MSGNIKYDKWINDDNSENYKCRAWVNFDGVGTVSIRASGNVSSITDNGAGLYTVNFTTAMVDASYSISGSAGRATASGGAGLGGFWLETNQPTAPSASSFVINVYNYNSTAADSPYINLAIFR